MQAPAHGPELVERGGSTERRCRAGTARYRVTDASGEDRSGRSLETAADEGGNVLRCRKHEGVRRRSRLEEYWRRWQRRRCAACGASAARGSGHFAGGVPLLRVVGAASVSMVRSCSGRHLVALAVVRVFWPDGLVAIHARRMRMRADQGSRTVMAVHASEHRCGSETVDGNRQGQKPHQGDPKHARHAKSLMHHRSGNRTAARVKDKGFRPERACSPLP